MSHRYRQSLKRSANKTPSQIAQDWQRRQLEADFFRSNHLMELSTSGDVTPSTLDTDRCKGQSSSHTPCINPGCAPINLFDANRCICYGSLDIPCSNPGCAKARSFGTNRGIAPTSLFGADRDMCQCSSQIPCTNPECIATSLYGTYKCVCQYPSPIPCSKGYATTNLFSTERCICQGSSHVQISKLGHKSQTIKVESNKQPKEVNKAADQYIHGTVNYPGGICYYEKGSLHCKFSNDMDKKSNDSYDQSSVLPYALKLPFERSTIPNFVPREPKKTNEDVVFIRPIHSKVGLLHKVSLTNNSKIKVRSYETMKKPCEWLSSLKRIQGLNLNPIKWITRSKLNPAINVRDETPSSYVEIESCLQALKAYMEFEPHPTGIVQNRPDYFTIPSLDELAKLFVRDKECIVRNFIIGRSGYGKILFPDSFSVAGLNIDEIVHINSAEVLLYPDAEKKPITGCGLNRRARIALFGVYPERNKICNFYEELKRVSFEQGSRFIDYVPETGTWEFEVEHFSKYGLSCPKESEQVASMKLSKISSDFKLTAEV